MIKLLLKKNLEKKHIKQEIGLLNHCQIYDPSSFQLKYNDQKKNTICDAIILQYFNECSPKKAICRRVGLNILFFTLWMIWGVLCSRGHVPFDDAGDDGSGDAKAKPDANCTALFPQAWQKAPERLLSLLIRFLCCTGIQISPVMTTQWIWTLSHSL